MLDFLKEKGSVIFLTAGVILALSMVVLSGCKIGDLVPVKISPTVQKELSAAGVLAPGRVSYNEALKIFEDWKTFVRRDAENKVRITQLFTEDIDEAGEIVGFLQSMGNEGLALSAPFLSTLPMGGLLGMGATFLGGWFLQRPGESRKKIEEQARTQAEKDALWNEAYAAGQAAAKGSA